MAKFDGFPASGTKFLAGLEKNNDKAWFDKHRKEGYDDALLEPGKALVEELGTKLKTIEPAINAMPKIGGSIFRINRDTRFSKDKRPYKTHFDMWFWTGEKKGWNASGFYLRVTGDKVAVGAGMHGFQKEALAKYREAVGDEKQGKELVKIVKKLEKSGYGVDGAHYKRVPKPFAQDHERADLLKYNALFVHLEGKAPPELRSKKFITWAMAHYKKCAPLHFWLKGALG